MHFRLFFLRETDVLILSVNAVISHLLLITTLFHIAEINYPSSSFMSRNGQKDKISYVTHGFGSFPTINIHVLQPGQLDSSLFGANLFLKNDVHCCFFDKLGKVNNSCLSCLTTWLYYINRKGFPPVYVTSRWKCKLHKCIRPLAYRLSIIFDASEIREVGM